MPATSTAAVKNTKLQLQATPTSGERFPNSTFLELIRDSGENIPQLLLYEDGQTTITPEQEYGGRRYVACENAREIRHLPSKLATYGSTGILFEGLREFIFQATAAPEDFCSLLTYFAVASLFCDCLNMAPCVLLWTPAVLDGIALMRMLSCLCFHPVLLANGILNTRTTDLRPITRLLCQPNTELDALLGGLQFPGFLDKGLRQISGATAVLVGNAELKSPFADTCLSISVPPLAKTFSLDDERAERELIQELQNRMLSYRLENYEKVQSQQFDAPGLSGTTRELARVFAKCLVGSPDLQERLVELLQSRNDADQVEAGTRLKSVIVEALIVVCHERRSSVHVADIGDLA